MWDRRTRQVSAKLLEQGEKTQQFSVASTLQGQFFPLIIFKGKSVWSTWTSDDALPDTSYAATERGWMTADVFYNWFKGQFILSVGQERPVLLLVDGRGSHLSLQVVQLAMNENITILKLPPHTTHMLQALDVGVFKAFKTTYDQRLTKWARKNVGEKLQKADFVKMISEIWKQADPVLIQKTFASTGVYDPSVPERANHAKINRERFDPQKLRAYDAFLEEKKREQAKKPAEKSTADRISVRVQRESDNLTVNINISSPEKKPPTPMKKTFEELLLESVRREPRSEPGQRKKITQKAAEVITSKVYLEQLKKQQEEKEKADRKKGVGKKTKVKLTGDTHTSGAKSKQMKLS